MGVCTSGCTDGDFTGFDEDAPYGRGNFVLEIIEARNLPAVDICDPFVKFWLEDAHDGLIKGRRARTATRRSTLRPVWRSVREMGLQPSAEDVLEVELWDQHTMGSEGPIAVARVLISDIDVKPNWFDMSRVEPDDPSSSLTGQSQNQSPVSISLRFIPGEPPVRKTVFLIRHGESVWNEAQAKGLSGLGEMLDYDHPLNQTGITQAQGLNRKWKEAHRSAGGSLGAYRNTRDTHLKAFLNSDCVLSSPLTRALQTALVALKGHPVVTKQGITLSRVIREVKGIGGLDSVGAAIGVDVARRAEDCLGELMGAQDAKDTMVVIDPADAVTEWWTGVDDRDTPQALNDRFIELMYTLRYGESRAPILVGHSLFFKEFFRRFTGAAFRNSSPELAQKLVENKIENCGCVAVNLEFSPNPTIGEVQTTELKFCQIVGAEMMFGSGFSESI